MRWAVGLLIDLAVGFFLLWFGLIVREAELRDVLAVAIWGCLSTAALLGSVSRWWDRWRRRTRFTNEEHTRAPHLTWSVVEARNRDSTYEVIAVCDVTGSLGVLDPDHTWAESVVDALGTPQPADGAPTTVTRSTERMDMPLGAPFQPGGRFDLRIQCAEDDPEPGERTVTWYVAYTDDDGRHGYLSVCSARVAVPGNRHRPFVLSKALDKKSRRERNGAYNRLIASERRRRRRG